VNKFSKNAAYLGNFFTEPIQIEIENYEKLNKIKLKKKKTKIIII
jgi:hypothetical protein